MIKKELTPWYPAETKPMREGVYDVGDGLRFHSPWFRLFMDGKWFAGDTTPERAVARPQVVNPSPWRGLREEPFR